MVNLKRFRAQKLVMARLVYTGKMEVFIGLFKENAETLMLNHLNQKQM